MKRVVSFRADSLTPEAGPRSMFKTNSNLRVIIKNTSKQACASPPGTYYQKSEIFSF